MPCAISPGATSCRFPQLPLFGATRGPGPRCRHPQRPGSHQRCVSWARPGSTCWLGSPKSQCSTSLGIALQSRGKAQPTFSDCGEMVLPVKEVGKAIEGGLWKVRGLTSPGEQTELEEQNSLLHSAPALCWVARSPGGDRAGPQISVKGKKRGAEGEVWDRGGGTGCRKRGGRKFLQCMVAFQDIDWEYS